MKRKLDYFASIEQEYISDDDSDLERHLYGQEEKNSFSSKICAMMHSFGDVKEPKEESVQLVHSILRDQMNILLREAENAACLRGSKEISHEDILFLMRRNKVKLKRLLDYLEVVDMHSSLIRDLKILEDDAGKRVSKCMQFLASIEDCEELTSILQDKTIIDHAARKRLERRNSMINLMNKEEYEEFSEKTVRASFCPRQKKRKFKKWLLQDHVTEFQLTPLAITMISFLARETVAEIVDMALLIKSKKLGGTQGLPYSHCSNPVDLPDQTETNFHLATPEAFEGMVSENKVDDMAEDSACTNARNACVIVESIPIDHQSENEVEMDKSSYAPYKDQSIPRKNDAASKTDVDSNVSSPQVSDHLSSTSQKVRENIPKSGTGYKAIYETSNSRSGKNSDSGTEVCSDASTYLVIEEDSETLGCKSDVDEASNDVVSDYVPNDSEKTTEESHWAFDVQEKKFSYTWYLSKMSDDGTSNPPTPLNSVLALEADKESKCMPSEDVDVVRENEPSLKMNAEISNMSDSDLLTSCLQECVGSSQNSFSPIFGSEGTFQETPVIAGTSNLSQGTSIVGNTPSKYELEAVTDVSDNEQMAGASDTRDCPSDISKDTAQIPYDVTSSVDLAEAASENEFLHRTAITAEEIRETFVRFQEPAPMLLFFSCDRIPRKTKLLCLADSSTFDIV